MTAQELDPNILPPRTQPGATIQDHVMYGAFLRHAATFESLAEAKEAKGESGASYRNAIMNKFGLTAAEHTRISTIAATYQTQYQALRQQLKAEIKNFQALNSPGNKHIPGTPAPAKSPALILLAKQIRQTTLQARDQVHAALGDARFAQVDTQIALLNQVFEEIGFDPDITSGYRNPAREAAQRHYYNDSRHMAGDAADISTNGGGKQTYLIERSAGIDQRGCVEPLTMQGTSSYTHIDWRTLSDPNGTFRHSSCGSEWTTK